MYPLHPFCTAFRRASIAEKADIIASMRATGYDPDQPITLYDDAVLDGGTRQDCAAELSITPCYTTFTGSEDAAIAFVLRRNKARKHLSKGELDLAGARLVEAKQGAPKGNLNQIGGVSTKVYSSTPLNADAARTRQMVADELGVSRAIIGKAREVLLARDPQIVAMVERGELSVSSAADGTRHVPREQQAQMTAQQVRDNVAKEHRLRPSKQKATPPPAPRPPHINLTKLDIGDERIHGQPVQLEPVSVQRLREAQIRVQGVAGRIKQTAGLDAQGFINDVEHMQAHVPMRGKTNGEQMDFAKIADENENLVDAMIDEAIERLATLRRLRKSRHLSVVEGD